VIRFMPETYRAINKCVLSTAEVNRHSTRYDILPVVNDGVSSVGVSAGLRVPGSNIPVTVDGTRVCALVFGTVRAW